MYDSATEKDEPDQMELDGNMDPDELYDDDQFYRENEAIPPAPKLQGDHSRPRGTFSPTSFTIPASASIPTTVEAPYQRREENLEGKYLCFIFVFNGLNSSAAFPSSRVITITLINFCASQLISVSSNIEWRGWWVEWVVGRLVVGWNNNTGIYWESTFPTQSLIPRETTEGDTGS